MSFSEFKHRIFRREIIFSLLAVFIISGLFVSKNFLLETNLFESTTPPTIEAPASDNVLSPAALAHIDRLEKLYQRRPSEESLWQLIQILVEYQAQKQIPYYLHIYETHYPRGLHISTIKQWLRELPLSTD